MHRILVIFCVVLLAGCSDSASQPGAAKQSQTSDKPPLFAPSKTPQTPPATKPPPKLEKLVVTAEELAKSDVKLDGKQVEVTGIVDFGSNDSPDGKPSVWLKSSVCCRMKEPEADRVDLLHEGQKVKILGKGGWSNTAVFDCEFVEISSSQAVVISAAELAKEYQNDKNATVAKYEKKWMIVDGNLLTTKVDNFFGFTLGDDSTKGVTITARGQCSNNMKLKQKITALKPGDKVRVLGKLTASVATDTLDLVLAKVVK